MSIWFKDATVEKLQLTRKSTMVDHIGIEFTEITPNSLKARMPVDERTRQPYGILHGGASAALAETVASVAANMTIDTDLKIAVGLDINTSHLKMAKDGYVTAEATPIQLGNKIQVWQVKAFNDAGDLVSLSRLTVMVLDKPKHDSP